MQVFPVSQLAKFSTNANCLVTRFNSVNILAKRLKHYGVNRRKQDSGRNPFVQRNIKTVHEHFRVSHKMIKEVINVFKGN